jgi:dCTP deaminase
MSFWSGETLTTRVANEQVISPFDPDLIDCGAYTMHMGRQAFVTPHERVRARYQKEMLQLGTGQSFSIPPGQFAFLLTKECVKIPRDVIAFISLKSRTKYKGLVNVSGFHVDPGFEGHLIYAVYNVGPQAILVDEGDPLFLIWFADLDRKDTEYYRKEPPQTKIGIDIRSGVPGQILSLQALSDRMDQIDHAFFQIKAAAAAFVAVVVVVLAFLAVPWDDWHHWVRALIN